jgi:hypothetical protein
LAAWHGNLGGGKSGANHTAKLRGFFESDESDYVSTNTYSLETFATIVFFSQGSPRTE